MTVVGFNPSVNGLAAVLALLLRDPYAPLWRARVVEIVNPSASAGRRRSRSRSAPATLGANAPAALAAAAMFAWATALDAELASSRTELIARRLRAVIEIAFDAAITHIGRAPAPPVPAADYARRVADLAIYVRQCHARRDPVAPGGLAQR
jgi:hypothetical protein